MDLREIDLGEQPAEPEPELEGLEDLDDDIAAPEASEKRHLRRGVVLVNEYFLAHPEMVVGEHGQRRGIYGPGWSYTCRARAEAEPLEAQLDTAFARLPADIFTANPGRPA